MFSAHSHLILLVHAGSIARSEAAFPNCLNQTLSLKTPADWVNECNRDVSPIDTHKVYIRRNEDPHLWGSVLAARILMLLSASIAFTLGVVHLVYTFSGSMLTPRDPALQISMSQISPVITNET